MIKPIETCYRGIRFRSRLEARYAILFDALGLDWEYEKEGFEIQGNRYLPDFYIPSRKWWIEIKGEEPTSQEQSLLYSVAEHTQANAAYIFFGQMKLPDVSHSYDGSESAYKIYPWWDSYYHFCICPECKRVGIQFEGRGARVCAECCPGEDRMHTADAPFIVRAYRDAIGARFEYDERK